MRDLLSRLRAALTPQAVAVLALALLIAGNLLSGKETDADPLEIRTQEALSSIAGAGEVTVVIRMRETETDGGFASSAYRQKVPCGAVAVAQGAGDPLIRLELEQALCALLGLPPAAVSVAEGGR